jgi:hypothetical protein
MVLLLLTAAAGLTVMLLIDAWSVVERVFPPLHRRRASREHEDEARADEQRLRHERFVEDLRGQEQVAISRYDVGACALADVLRARAIRLVAEIDLLRGRRPEGCTAAQPQPNGVGSLFRPTP